MQKTLTPNRLYMRRMWREPIYPLHKKAYPSPDGTSVTIRPYCNMRDWRPATPARQAR